MSLLYRGILQNEKQTCQLAQSLASIAAPGDVFALSGDLGAGKSTFARAFIRAVSADPDLDVPSPTFTIVQGYEMPNGCPVLHADLYRLGGPEDVEDLGLDEEADGSILLVEWPDRMPQSWWRNALCLELQLMEKAGSRQLNISAVGDHWQTRLQPILPCTGME